MELLLVGRDILLLPSNYQSWKLIAPLLRSFEWVLSTSPWHRFCGRSHNLLVLHILSIVIKRLQSSLRFTYIAWFENSCMGMFGSGVGINLVQSAEATGVGHAWLLVHVYEGVLSHPAHVEGLGDSLLLKRLVRAGVWPKVRQLGVNLSSKTRMISSLTTRPRLISSILIHRSHPTLGIRINRLLATNLVTRISMATSKHGS